MLSQEISAFLLILVVDLVFPQCNEGCKSCTGSTCTSCESSYFLSNGFCSACPENCERCNSYGDCTSCKPTTFSLLERCTFPCDGNCLNSECADDTGYCSQCKPGFYGLQCQHNCSFCADERCDLRTCSSGCIDGYYEDKNGVETICQNCPKNCKYCTDGKTCSICNNRFHLYKFNDNVHCLSCLQESQCSNYCVIQGCNQCQLHNDSLVCAECPEEQIFNGITCGCNQTFWGDTCDKPCPGGCKNDICNRNNGACTDGYKDGLTGDWCTHTITIETSVTKKTTTTTTTTSAVEPVTQQQTCARCDDKVHNFTISYFSGFGSCVGIEVISVLLYLIRRRYLASKTTQDNKPNVEIPTYYNTRTDFIAVNTESVEVTNNYESLGNNRTTDNVYNDLGTTLS